jgi:cytochrome c biogenesis protein
MSLTAPQKTVSPALETMPQKPNRKTFPEQVWDMLACFRSVQLAIVLLSLLAAATMAGVLIPQEGVVDILQIKRDYGENYRMFKAMGLFNVYSSYWFIALEVLFFFNLLFGSFQWLKPAFLAATRTSFYSAAYIQSNPERLVLNSPESLEATTGRVSTWLRKNRYKVHQASAETPANGSRQLYGTKGNFFRFGAVVVHTGILMMLVSSVYGVFYGFKAQKLATPGETFSLQDSQMFKTNIDPSLWQGSVPDWKVRVNDFRIEYYPEGQAPDKTAVVKQYFADLSVIDKTGKETKREVISVNHPLAVDDTVLYQASFNPTGKLFMEVNGKPIEPKINTEMMGRPVSMSELPDGKALLIFPFFVQQDPDVTRNNVVVFLRDSKGFVGAKPGKMPPNLRLREGEEGNLSGIHFKYVKPEFATGLQIKKGPEVPWMYLSYIIIIVGTIMCIFTQRQVWVAITEGTDGQPTRFALMFKTKKAKLSFMKELQRMQVDLRKAGYSGIKAPAAKPQVLSAEKVPVHS